MRGRSLSRFMRKAYRRPVTAAEIDAKMKLFDLARRDKKPLESIKLPLTAILSSPNFLYLVEPTSDGADGPTSLDDFELASRLSYFLWSSTPDDRLAELAEKGRLKDRATRIQEVDRMLADPRAQRSSITSRPSGSVSGDRCKPAGRRTLSAVRSSSGIVDRSRVRGVFQRNPLQRPGRP